jgi:hypothetical protein
MKFLSYVLGLGILLSGIDVIFTMGAMNLSACPRCRKALPKGPRKLPHPGFPKKESKQSVSTNNLNDNVQRSGMKERFDEPKQ